ncbi:MAG: hypothetical protein HWE18_13925 [Gammaproteobacteria bacterium]|nr:hypothetical protein [Gammaproteobacteria bacterium]
MKIERGSNDNGQCYGFSFKNRKVSRSGTAQIIEQLEGTEITHYPRWSDSDVFCTFTFRGIEFEAYEMWGDSDEYTISAHKPDLEELEIIAKHFEASAPIIGGDFAHNLYFLVNWAIFSWVIIGIGYAVWAGSEWIFS